jgi:DHA1 family multidrug resistance protein-like MFS transporter
MSDYLIIHDSLYTIAVYMGASLFTPAEPYVEKIFGVSATGGSLGLALYVLGCKCESPGHCPSISTHS